MLTQFKLREMVVENRVVMSPMAQYSADEHGNPTDWHKIHYGSHALGGMGLMFVEMTCPSVDARITLKNAVTPTEQRDNWCCGSKLGP